MARTPFDFKPAHSELNFAEMSSRPEVAAASFELSFREAETHSIFRKIRQSQEERTDDITDHSKLNEMFPGMQVPFNKPMSLALAKQLNSDNDEKMALARTIANGEQDGINTAISLTAGIGAQIVDPVGIALGLFTGVGITKLLGNMALAGTGISKAITAAKAGPGFTKGAIGLNMIEGIVGNVVGEMGIVSPIQKSEQQDIDSYQNFKNAVIGGIAFPAVIGAGARSIEFFKGDPHRMYKALGLIRNQMENGKQPDVTILENVMRKQNLPNLKEQLEVAKREQFPLDQIKDLEDQIIETEAIPSVERQIAIEEANSREKDLYHDTEVEIQNAERRGEPTEEISVEAQTKYDGHIEEMKQYKDQDNWDAEDLAAQKEVEEEFKQAEVIDTAIKAAQVCVKG